LSCFNNTKELTAHLSGYMQNRTIQNSKFVENLSFGLKINPQQTNINTFSHPKGI